MKIIFSGANCRQQPNHIVKNYMNSEEAMSNWIDVCDVDEIEEEDVIRFDHKDHTFAIYKSEAGEIFATDGLCTHEQVHLSDGLVMDNIIECPKHNGQFNYKTGAATRNTSASCLGKKS